MSESATPEQLALWEAVPEGPKETMADKWQAVKEYFGAGFQAFMFGSYSYAYLCAPTLCPWKKSSHKVQALLFPLSNLASNLWLQHIKIHTLHINE